MVDSRHNTHRRRGSKAKHPGCDRNPCKAPTRVERWRCWKTGHRAKHPLCQSCETSSAAMGPMPRTSLGLGLAKHQHCRLRASHCEASSQAARRPRRLLLQGVDAAARSAQRARHPTQWGRSNRHTIILNQRKQLRHLPVAVVHDRSTFLFHLQAVRHCGKKAEKAIRC